MWQYSLENDFDGFFEFLTGDRQAEFVVAEKIEMGGAKKGRSYCFWLERFDFTLFDLLLQVFVQVYDAWKVFWVAIFGAVAGLLVAGKLNQAEALVLFENPDRDLHGCLHEFSWGHGVGAAGFEFGKKIVAKTVFESVKKGFFAGKVTIKCAFAAVGATDDIVDRGAVEAFFVEDVEAGFEQQVLFGRFACHMINLSKKYETD